MSHVIGLDIGGTKVAGGIVDADGTILERQEMSSATAEGIDPGGAVTYQVARDLLDRAAERGIAIAALGAGYPEYVSRQGRVTSNLVLPDSFDSERRLTSLGLPTVIESDVRAGALAENRFGAGAGARSSLYVSLGTGLSCTLITGGAVWPGERGEALAMGELDVPMRPLAQLPDAVRCAQEAEAGNLEQFCSGAGIAARYAARTGRQISGTRQVVNAGDEHAAQVLTSAGIALGAVLAGLVSVLDPAIVVLGGGLGCAPGVVADHVRGEYDRRVAARPQPPQLVIARLGADAGVVGAAAAAMTLVNA